MELENIIEYYQKDSKTKRIVEHLKEPQPIIHLKGMNGAAEAFVAASLFRSTSYHHLFIMSDKEKALASFNWIQSQRLIFVIAFLFIMCFILCIRGYEWTVK